MRSSTGRTRGVASREGAILGAASSVTGQMMWRLKIARCAPVVTFWRSLPAKATGRTLVRATRPSEVAIGLRFASTFAAVGDPLQTYTVETRCCPASSPTCRQGCRSSCRRGRRRRSSRSSWTTTTRARSRAGRSARRLSPCWSRSTRSSPSQVRPRPSRGPLAAATNAAPTPSINAMASAPPPHHPLPHFSPVFDSFRLISFFIPLVSQAWRRGAASRAS